MLTEIHIAVREFAQPNERRGHIDMLSGYRPELALGVEIHQRLQTRFKQEVTGFESEVQITGTFECEDFKFVISGRIDGLIKSPTEIIIEEIKSTSSLEKLSQVLNQDPLHPYALQTKLYAMLLSLSHPDVQLRCQIRLVSSLNSQEKVVAIPFNLQEFLQWRDERAAYLIRQKKAYWSLLALRKSTSKAMQFPFPQTREPQRLLMQRVEKTVDEGRQLLVQAPTGLGKTAGVMFPTLKAALYDGKQLIYVTPKNSQHRLAEEVVARLQGQGPEVQVRSLTMTAKSKICMQPEPICTPDHCPYARNYYDKLSEHQILPKLKAEPQLNASVFKSYAETYQVCPFELSLDAMTDVDVVIGDYNYVFAPRAALGRLLYDDNEESQNNYLMIDEVHNLAQRLSDYLSPTLELQVFTDLAERSDEIPVDLQKNWKKLLSRCQRAISSYANASQATKRWQVELDPEYFFDIEKQVSSFTMLYFSSLEEPRRNDPVTRLQRYWGDFCFALAWEHGCSFFTFRTDTASPSLKITCASGAALGADAMRHFKSVIGFSATTKPFDYYAQLCGFSDSRLDVAEFSSPFPTAKRKLMVIPQINTRFKFREQNYSRVGDAISRIASRRRGNYFAFFPSFDFLKRTAPFIQVPGFRILTQDPYMSAADAELIIDGLKEQSRQVLVLAVQGGIFAEGVDYPGDLLIGAFIVGPGLPAFDFERELLRKFYEEKFGDGFSYAYVYPGMTRVVQAAGRVIRTEDDVGLIVLMDDRFTDPQYLELMPKDWMNNESGADALVSRKILSDVDQFWERWGLS